MLFQSKIEFFDGAIRVNPYIFAIDILLAIHFIYFWYVNYKRWGWKIDFWQLTMIRLFLFPLIILYPFIGSFKNQFYTSPAGFKILDPYLDKAYLLTLTGYISIYIGRYLYNLFRKRNLLDSFFNPIEKVIEKNIKNINSVTLINVIALLLFALIIYLQLGENNLFDPRGYFLRDGRIRPLYNLLLIFYPLAIAFTGVRLMNQPSGGRKLYFLFLLILSLFLGTRMGLMEPLMWLFVILGMYKIKYFTLKKIALFGLVFIYSAFILLMLRSGNFSTTFFKEVFYGNSFSDVRDFALLLGSWDGNFLQGKTYLAGLISFIPRELSEFREAWALGKFTARITNYNPATFPGFRPGYFGEVFFNFGVTGVVFLGIISGYILRYLDVKMKESIKNGDTVQAYARTFPFLVISALSISLGFTVLYVFALINFLCFIFRKAIIYVNIHKPKAQLK